MLGFENMKKTRSWKAQTRLSRFDEALGHYSQSWLDSRLKNAVWGKEWHFLFLSSLSTPSICAEQWVKRKWTSYQGSQYWAQSLLIWTKHMRMCVCTTEVVDQGSKSENNYTKKRENPIHLSVFAQWLPIQTESFFSLNLFPLYFLMSLITDI